MDIVSYLLGKKAGGGGGNAGLEYEEGTYIPETNKAKPIINFANPHSSMPVFVQMSCCEDTFPTTTSVNYWAYIDVEKITGKPILYSPGVSSYVQVLYGTVSNGNASTITDKTIFRSSDQTKDDDNGYPRYYVKPNSFIPGAQGNNASYFLAGRTYKWIAIWK